MKPWMISFESQCLRLLKQLKLGTINADDIPGVLEILQDVIGKAIFYVTSERFKIQMIMLKKKGDGTPNASFITLDVLLKEKKYGKSRDIHKKAKEEGVKMVKQLEAELAKGSMTCVPDMSIALDFLREMLEVALKVVSSNKITVEMVMLSDTKVTSKNKDKGLVSLDVLLRERLQFKPKAHIVFKNSQSTKKKTFSSPPPSSTPPSGGKSGSQTNLSGGKRGNQRNSSRSGKRPASESNTRNAPKRGRQSSSMTPNGERNTAEKRKMNTSAGSNVVNSTRNANERPSVGRKRKSAESNPAEDMEQNAPAGRTNAFLTGSSVVSPSAERKKNSAVADPAEKRDLDSSSRPKNVNASSNSIASPSTEQKRKRANAKLPEERNLNVSSGIDCVNSADNPVVSPPVEPDVIVIAPDDPEAVDEINTRCQPNHDIQNPAAKLEQSAPSVQQVSPMSSATPGEVLVIKPISPPVVKVSHSDYGSMSERPSPLQLMHQPPLTQPVEICGGRQISAPVPSHDVVTPDGHHVSVLPVQYLGSLNIQAPVVVQGLEQSIIRQPPPLKRYPTTPYTSSTDYSYKGYDDGDKVIDPKISSTATIVINGHEQNLKNVLLKNTSTENMSPGENWRNRSSTESCESTGEPAVERNTTIETQRKRGPGRLPKNNKFVANMSPSENVRNRSSSTESCDSSGESTGRRHSMNQPPNKRRPGRPPKIRVALNKKSDSTIETNIRTSEETVRKKRKVKVSLENECEEVRSIGMTLKNRRHLQFTSYTCYICYLEAGLTKTVGLSEDLVDHIRNKHFVMLRNGNGVLKCHLCNHEYTLTADRMKGHSKVMDLLTPHFNHLMNSHQLDIPPFLLVYKCRREDCHFMTPIPEFMQKHAEGKIHG